MTCLVGPPLLNQYLGNQGGGSLFQLNIIDVPIENLDFDAKQKVLSSFIN